MFSKHNHIKSLIIAICCLFCLAGGASGATLMWGASSGTVTGYKVYYGTSASNPGTSLEVGNVTQYSIDSLPLTENRQYYFCVTAFNSAGESPPCAPVAYTPADSTPPLPPTGLVAQ